jgi:hypothetical protein
LPPNAFAEGLLMMVTRLVHCLFSRPMLAYLVSRELGKTECVLYGREETLWGTPLRHTYLETRGTFEIN